MKPLKFNYKTGGSQILNNGHTVQVVYDAGSNVVIDGVEYGLKQFHFHAPSENLIQGESYPLEAILFMPIRMAPGGGDRHV